MCGYSWRWGEIKVGERGKERWERGEEEGRDGEREGRRERGDRWRWG